MASREGKLLRPIYFYALVGVVAAVVLVSGALQITRTRSELVKIYEANGLTVADSVEGLVERALTLLEISTQGAGESSETLALDDLLLEYLAGQATAMDQALAEKTPATLEIGDTEIFFRLLTAQDINGLSDPSESELIRSLTTGQETIAIRRISPGFGRAGYLLLALQRHFGPGVVVLTVMDEHRYSLLKRLLLQDILLLFRERQDLLDMILVDDRGELLARLQNDSQVGVPNATLGGKKDTVARIFITRHGDEPALDLTKGLYFRDKRVAILRVSVSMVGMERILTESRRATVLLSAVLLLIGFMLVRLIFWRQEATLKHVQQMEGEMRRRQELSALGEMAAGVAHEIRNPLNAISMGLQSLAIQGGETAESTTKSAVELLETLRREVASINRIVSEFLSVSRPENLEVEEFDSAELLDHVSKLLHQSAAEQGVEVRLDKEGSGCRVSGDRDKLTQALLNVCVNALEACDSGGVMTLRLLCRKALAQIEVADTGSGINPQDQVNLFRPHFTTKEKGLGLGLFLAQRILQAHGGNIFLEKSSSRGTTMVLTVPRTSN